MKPRPRSFVERAAAADAPALARLAGECFAQPWSERQFAEELARRPPDAVLVARSPSVASRPASALVAFCAYRVVLDELHVLDVAVAASSRRLGLGRLLLELALRRGSRAGARAALLEVRAGNRPALALYEAAGFVAVGRRRHYYREPIEDALLLERALDELC